MTSDRRLIEDFIPIREISIEATREKSIRKSHISTLHLWWARRPLVAARAAVFPSLVAAPETPQKRNALSKAMIELCKWQAGEATLAKARKQILEAQRDRLNLPSDTPLNQVPPSKVLDMFSGGGAIPLEALRLGCESYAVELNPVAHIIELCTLVYPQKYGNKLADEVEKWGNWVIEKVREEIGDLYPKIVGGEVLPEEYEQLELLEQPKAKQLTLGQKLTPVAYFWTRTVKCPNPACNASVPLVRQTWLCKTKDKYVALKVIPNHQTKQVEFEVVEATTEKGLGFDPSVGSLRGNSTCRYCGTTVKSDYVKEQGKADQIGQKLMAIICTNPVKKGKFYLSANQYQHYLPNEEAMKSRLDKLCKEAGLKIPSEPIFSGDSRAFFTHLYGLDNFGRLYTSRQLLALMTFAKWVRLAHQTMIQQRYESELAKAIGTYLGVMIDKLADKASTLCTYEPHPTRVGVRNVFTRQALPMVLDFAEGYPLGESSGSASKCLSWITDFIQQEASSGSPAICQRSNAMSLPLEAESIDAVITDPPYFDSVPYADLSDFFYIWLKRAVGHLYPEHFSGQLTPKKNEAIMEPSRYGGNKPKAAKAYEDMMHQAFCEASRVLKTGGTMVVVYAHKTTTGWVTLMDSLRRAGFTITEAWPLDTERNVRLRGQNSAALASSIFLVARKRKDAKVGDYAMDVRPLLAEIVRDRGAFEDLGIQKTERQQTFNVKPQAIGAAPTLIDILHRLLWLSEHKPLEIPNFLALAQPDATQLRLVAQALAGRALTPEPGQEDGMQGRTQEQQAIDTLLASWKRVVEENLFTQRK